MIVLSSLIMLGLGTSFACFDVENHRLRVATEIVAGLLLIGGLATLGFGLRFLGL